LSESVQSAWFSCSALDVIAIHAYGTGDFATSTIQPYVTQAVAAGKKLLFQEWYVPSFLSLSTNYIQLILQRGACYFNTENNNCPTGTALSTSTRNSNIQTWARQIAAAGVPWLYWQVIPNNDPHYDSDYEVGIGESGFATLAAAAKEALSDSTPFDYSAYLL
jgi:mannan endo-1,4-beta-mannosidase